MATESLTRLADRELLKLFAVTSTLSFTKRAKQVFAELERRGYLFDTERKDFVTCEQRNQRYSRTMPVDCKEKERAARRAGAS